MITITGHKQHSYAELMVLITQIKAIIYVRVSTVDQAEHGFSLQSQIEKSKLHLQKKFDYTEKEMLVIIEPGESGDNPDRAGLNHALYLLEEGVGKKLVLLHPDRLSRYLALQTNISQKIWNMGCDLEFVEFDIDPNNPESMLMYNIQGSIAQYNKAKILANSKRGRKQMLSMGKIPGLRRVYGYTFDKKEDTLVENTAEKSVYMQMVNWLLNGKDGAEISCTKIARELSRQGVPAPNGPYWYQSTVSRILHNEIYTGTFYYGKTERIQNKSQKVIEKKPREQWHPIHVPAYITKQTYAKIKKRLVELNKKGRGRKSKNYLLKGINKCGRCGGAVVAGPSSKLKDKTLFYYTCVNKATKKFKVHSSEAQGVCRGRNWRQDVIDEYVWNYLKEKLHHLEPVIEQIIEDIVDEHLSMHKHDELIKKQNKMTAYIHHNKKEQKKYHQLFVKDFIDENELEENVRPLKAKEEELKAELDFIAHELQNLDHYPDKPQLLKEYKQHYTAALKKLDFEQKRKIIQLLINKVVLNDDTIEVMLKYYMS